MDMVVFENPPACCTISHMKSATKQEYHVLLAIAFDKT